MEIKLFSSETENKTVILKNVVRFSNFNKKKKENEK